MDSTINQSIFFESEEDMKNIANQKFGRPSKFIHRLFFCREQSKDSI